MKHKAFRWIPAVLLAALLAGCGAKTAAFARPASSRELKSTPPDSMHATAAITEQYTLEKVVQTENGSTVRLNIHLPRLESDSADAARINAEIARYYEYDVQEYAGCPEAADPESWDICIEMNWNASWYSDCVSLVVSSCYGSTDAPFHNGWCFDFESGNQLTATQLLQRMGADPAALEEALYRDVKRRDELDRQTACERGLLPPDSLKEGNTAWWATLDELPLSFDEAGNVSFVVRRSSAAQEQYTDDKVTIPLDAQPLPQDWEWQVLAEWMAVTAVTQGESYAPADRNESFTLRLEKAEITGPKKGSEVWYVFQRTEAWDDIGFTAIPRRLWGTYRAGDEAAKGIRWMTFLPDGSCCMSVGWDGWNGILTGTAEGTQGRIEDGTELYFTLTDQNGKPCEFGAILLNDDGSPSGCSLKYRAGEVLFDRDTRPVYWKNDSPDLTLVP